MKITGGNVSLIHTRPGLNSTAEADDQGRVKLTITGSSPKNEDDALNICARLVRVLNSSGTSWSDPIQGKQDVDGYSESPDGEKLNMQVVRSNNNRELWKELGTKGKVSTQNIASEVAKELIATIEEKSRQYPPAQKKDLCLVLDAARTANHTFQKVLDAFKGDHIPECQAAGFQQVWIVGPQDSIVYRLDT